MDNTTLLILIIILLTAIHRSKPQLVTFLAVTFFSSVRFA